MKQSRITLAGNIAIQVFGWAYEAKSAESPGGEQITAGEVAQLLNGIGNFLLAGLESPYKIHVEVKPGEELKRVLSELGSEAE